MIHIVDDFFQIIEKILKKRERLIEEDKNITSMVNDAIKNIEFLERKIKSSSEFSI